MSELYQMAIAINKDQRPGFEENGADTLFLERERRNLFRSVERSGKTYIIYVWDWEPVNDEKYMKMWNHLMSIKHAMIRITEEGEIQCDCNTEDEFGCDDDIEDILGWKTSICLWNDETKELTGKTVQG